jgi:hypothetical protein
MKARLLSPVVLAVTLLGVNTLCAQQTGSAVQATAGSAAQGVDASRVFLPCTPVAAYWTGSPPSQGMPPGPNLAVVSFKVRPKDARVHLDGRFVGRARYLDGKPGYLYLEPGSYDLELRHEGYRTVLVKLDARAACRYDMKHRLESDHRASTGVSEKEFGKGRPFNRVFKPLETTGEEVKPTRQAGPDTSLRRDLGSLGEPAERTATEPGASLRLRVTPDAASISIDGEFVATARELRMMEGPLATTAGKHRVVVRAPGFQEATKDVELAEGEVLELEISLFENRTE